MNSHIQTPKCILKNFENDKHFIYHYCIEDEHPAIKKGHAETFYTQTDYYSDYMEWYLNVNVETPLGKVAKFVKEITLNIDYVFNEDYKLILDHYVHSLFLRGKRMPLEIVERTQFFQFLPETAQHDFPIVFTKENDEIINWISKYEYTILANVTSTPFVLPTIGLITFDSSFDNRNLIPITPYRAICMIPRDDLLKYIKNGKMTSLKIDNEKLIRSINNYAFEQLKLYGYGGLICSEINELNRIINQQNYSD